MNIITLDDAVNAIIGSTAIQDILTNSSQLINSATENARTYTPSIFSAQYGLDYNIDSTGSVIELISVNNDMVVNNVGAIFIGGNKNADSMTGGTFSVSGVTLHSMPSPNPTDMKFTYTLHNPVYKNGNYECNNFYVSGVENTTGIHLPEVKVYSMYDANDVGIFMNCGGSKFKLDLRNNGGQFIPH